MKASGDLAACWHLTAAAATALFLWVAMPGAEGSSPPAAPAAQSRPAPAPAASRPAVKVKVLMLGDSLTKYGLAAPTEKELNALAAGAMQWTAVNAGVGGEAAEAGKGRIAALLDSERPDLVTVEYGANDMGKRYTSQQFREHLEGIVKIVQSHASGARVVLMTVTPIDANRHSFGKNKEFNDKGGPDYVLETEYNAAARLLAQEKGLPLVDMHRYFQTAKDPYALLVKDGIHLTPEGYAFLSKHVARALSEYYCAEVLKDRQALSARGRATVELLDLRKERLSGDSNAQKAAARLESAWEACPYMAQAAAEWHKATYPPPATQPAATEPAEP